MDTTTLIVTSPPTHRPDLHASKEDCEWVKIGDAEFCFPGGKYLKMRPKGFALARGAFTKMIVLINDRHYDAPKVNRKRLTERMPLDGVHRIWIGAGDLEYSFDGVDRVDLVGMDSNDPHRRHPEFVYSFNLNALYRILDVFTSDPYAE